MTMMMKRKMTTKMQMKMKQDEDDDDDNYDDQGKDGKKIKTQYAYEDQIRAEGVDGDEAGDKDEGACGRARGENQDEVEDEHEEDADNRD